MTGGRSAALRVALWHPDGLRVLLRDGALPQVELAADADLTASLRAAWGLESWLLHDGGRAMGREGAAQLQALGDQAPGGFGWGQADLSPLAGARAWQRPGWPQRAASVLETALEQVGLRRTGRLDPVHHHDLVAVVRAQTERGAVYLKASETGREAAVTARLAQTLPDLLPPLLWADPGAGLLVSASGGKLLDGVAELTAWEQALERLARLQTGADATALARLGCPAWPLDEVTGRVDTLLGDRAALETWGLGPEHIGTLEEARPAVRSAFRDLGALGLPDLPAHGDAHPRNALHGPRGSVWFDLSEAASAAHPFMDAGWFLAFTLHPARAKLPVRLAQADLEARLAAAYVNALGCPGADRLLLKTLPLALLHRAAVYDAQFRGWEGTVPGWRPEYTPFYLKQAVRELARLA
ncbi:hypothetical protein [Deinococcus budaensis]|uniref:Aminoglycoside phosphotransferase domain-containing protein n=1 Tax=Deinococcus budaensis TaxID=1665626 RepID=A0A7W8GH92_9DEIO|nr:hypothetical protein [Deinococcus budaensis]MBB5235304.1 hypothetical protein [Deinococcus budaensis]